MPYFDFDIERVKKDALAMNPDLKVFVLSATSREGMDEWIEFLKNKLKK
jgi:hydrogenase nickel incorporation protein HypB